MAPIDDETLDRLLGRHLSARLDGQLGRAEPAFRRALASGALDDVLDPSLLASDEERRMLLTPDAAPRGVLANRWLIGALGFGLAASLAVVLMNPNLNQPGQAGDTTGSVAQSSPAPDRPAEKGRGAPGGSIPAPPTVRYVQNRTIDEGTTMPPGSDSPIKRLRRQQVEHLRYFDRDRGAWVDLVVPRENVEMLELDTY